MAVAAASAVPTTFPKFELPPRIWSTLTILIISKARGGKHQIFQIFVTERASNRTATVGHVYYLKTWLMNLQWIRVRGGQSRLRRDFYQSKRRRKMRVLKLASNKATYAWKHIWQQMLKRKTINFRKLNQLRKMLGSSSCAQTACTEDKRILSKTLSRAVA